MAAKFEEVTTPIGTAVWPRINKPDTKFDKNGAYSMRLRLEGGEAEALVKLVEDRCEKLYKEECAKRGGKKLKKAGLPFKPAVDKDRDGTETEVEGAVDFNTKRKAGGERKDGSKWSASVAIFDSQGNPTKAEVWGGSKVRARVALVPWFTDSLGFGVRLELRAVQVIELVSGGTRDAAGYGFDGVDGGFVETGEAKPEEAAEEGTGSGADLDQF